MDRKRLLHEDVVSVRILVVTPALLAARSGGTETAQTRMVLNINKHSQAPLVVESEHDIILSIYGILLRNVLCYFPQLFFPFIRRYGRDSQA
jgi:hypothetical protein